MAKNLSFILLFCFIGTAASLFALNVPMSPSPPEPEICNAPPPDSFIIFDLGEDYVTLAWQPSAGATYTLTLLRENLLMNSWDTVSYVNHWPGDTYTFTNLQLSKHVYKAGIARECHNGDPSGIVSFSPSMGAILDLVLAGRTPVNPTPVAQCSAISYENFNWTGFRFGIGTGINAVSNYFEFDFEEGERLIKRPTNTTELVAAEIGTGDYPTINKPKVQLIDPSFEMRRVVNGVLLPVVFARITVEHSPIDKTVKICLDDDPPLCLGCTFTPMTAQTVNGLMAKHIEDRTELVYENDQRIVVENPFSDGLRIFFPKSFAIAESIKISLFNFHGETFFKDEGIALVRDFILPTQRIPMGVYLLKIETESLSEIFKVIKYR